MHSMCGERNREKNTAGQPAGYVAALLPHEEEGGEQNGHALRPARMLGSTLEAYTCILYGCIQLYTLIN